MKKLVFLTLAFALSASFAFGAFGDVVASFAAPANYPIALGVPGNYTSYLWAYCNTSPYRIYRMGGRTGSVYSSFVSPRGSATRGLSYNYSGGGGLPSGSYMWMGSSTTDRIYRCNYNNGSAYASIPANHDMYGGIAVMATGDGGRAPTYMLSDDTSPRYIYRQSLTSGTIYSSFAPSMAIYDLAWDWRNGVIWTGSSGNYIYAYRTTGARVGSMRIPANYPLAACYTSNYLWVGTTTGSHRIWMMHCPNTLGVEPTSVGKIKSLYR
jgi:hypothetical protein